MTELKKTAKQEAAPKYTGPTIYVGPTLKNGALKRFDVFVNGEYSQLVKELIESNADIKALVIPCTQLGAFDARLRDQSSVEFLRFNRVKGL